MISTDAPAPLQNEANFATALGLVPSGGVNMVQRLKKSVENPASGPDCSVPATGCDGTKWTMAGRCGATALMIEALTDPTSDTIAPGLRCGPISRAIAPMTPTGAQRMTRRAASTAAASVAVARSASARSVPLARTALDESGAIISRASPLRRQTCARDEPIRPMPMRARRWNRGSLRGPPRPSGTRGAFKLDEVLEGLDNETVRLRRADREPQAMRQPVGADNAQDQPPLQEEAVHRLRLRLAVEMQKQEVANAWRDLDPERGDFLRQPREPSLVMGDGLANMASIIQR